MVLKKVQNVQPCPRHEKESGCDQAECRPRACSDESQGIPPVPDVKQSHRHETERPEFHRSGEPEQEETEPPAVRVDEVERSERDRAGARSNLV